MTKKNKEQSDTPLQLAINHAMEMFDGNKEEMLGILD